MYINLRLISPCCVDHTHRLYYVTGHCWLTLTLFRPNLVRGISILDFLAFLQTSVSTHWYVWTRTGYKIETNELIYQTIVYKCKCILVNKNGICHYIYRYRMFSLRMGCPDCQCNWNAGTLPKSFEESVCKLSREKSVCTYLIWGLVYAILKKVKQAIYCQGLNETTIPQWHLLQVTIDT